jgi:hypothetical protein
VCIHYPDELTSRGSESKTAGPPSEKKSINNPLPISKLPHSKVNKNPLLHSVVALGLGVLWCLLEGNRRVPGYSGCRLRSSPLSHKRISGSGALGSDTEVKRCKRTLLGKKLLPEWLERRNAAAEQNDKVLGAGPNN